MRYQGRISKWKDDKGFGFITPNGGGEQVFVHISSFSNRLRRPGGDEIVTYKLEADAKGRVQARAVAFVGERTFKPNRSRHSNIPLIFTACFLFFVAVTVAMGRLPIPVLLIYLIASIVAFLAYALDKSAAQQNGWRTQESTLHLLAFFGGWPGALAAQRLLRHKSAKASFQATFWITVVLNCAALAWLSLPQGAKALYSVFGVT